MKWCGQNSLSSCSSVSEYLETSALKKSREMPYIFPPAGPESTEKSLAKKQWHFTETLKQGVNTETPLHLRWCSTVLSGNSCPRSPSCRRLCSGSSSRWWTSSLFLTKWPKERSWGSHRSLQRSPEIQRWSSSSSWTDGGSHPQNRGSSTTHSSQAEGECVCVCVCAPRTTADVFH